MGCGARAPQGELLRIARRADGTLQVVHTPPAGRTGYLHRSGQCWERFAARKGPLRSLGHTVDKAVRLDLVQELTRQSSATTR